VVAPSASGASDISPALFETTARDWQAHETLHDEAFGPGAVVVHCDTIDQLAMCLSNLDGSLTGSLHVGAGEDRRDVIEIFRHLQRFAGRVIVNGYPTGVEVIRSIVHGGPYPATTDVGTTSVGPAAIARWVRPVAFQGVPDALLPPALQDANPLGIDRTVNGMRSCAPVQR
jgi:acyl-CoA reductase-like NAD-dependent aldehyde dehydrogenase